jgi:glycosyltransferase involved in cell wall biosynthesis
MHILTALTYYRPYYSGLTIYTERLARALAKRGHHVTVLTSRYQSDFPAHEVRDGVEIIRPRVLAHVSKGVLMPTLPYWAWVYSRRADVVHLHLPQLDAAYIAMLCRLIRKPVVLTYHCDLRLPPGFVHAIANRVSHLANYVSAGLADAVVTNTRDYAEESGFLSRYLNKLHAIPPPVELPPVTAADLNAFRQKAHIRPGQRIIGMAARLATEKGVEYLVQAMPQVLKAHPTARLLYMGQYQNVLGEEEYAHRLAPLIRELGGAWTFLGNISSVELSAFYRLCEVTVLPSLNSTESFGIVQVESMTCGTPVVASDLPGVRQPVKMTGMGRIVPPQDAASLAQAIIEILDEPAKYRRDAQAAETIAQRFSPLHVAEEYEALFRELLKT